MPYPKQLHGSINHVSLTVSDLDEALTFFRPLLTFFDYQVSNPSPYAGTRLAVSINEAVGIAINIWQAKTQHPFDVYEPGLHHLAINAGTHTKVDEAHELVKSLGGTILDGPGEFPFAMGGYYACYFLGPDNIKLEVVHMPELESLYRQ